MVRKIVAIGPESTGKSTLCRQLAEHYQTLYCPEFAREYLLHKGASYDYEDLLTIAKGQTALEDEYASRIAKQEGLLFLDTDMYVMKIWCEFVFGKCHRYILQQIVERKYDLYLLCKTDLPWVRDKLREYPEPEKRERLYLMYKDLLINQDVPWVEISGNDEQRLKKAINAIDKELGLR